MECRQTGKMTGQGSQFEEKCFEVYIKATEH